MGENKQYNTLVIESEKVHRLSTANLDVAVDFAMLTIENVMRRERMQASRYITNISLWDGSYDLVLDIAHPTRELCGLSVMLWSGPGVPDWVTKPADPSCDLPPIHLGIEGDAT